MGAYRWKKQGNRTGKETRKRNYWSTGWKWSCPLCEKTAGILGAMPWDGSEAKQQFMDQD